MSIILKLTVQDRHGVLDRITGLIRRNGWNISEINAGETGGGLSTINIRMKDRGADLQVLGNHLSKLDCIKAWETCSTAEHFIRELLILKIAEADYNTAPIAGSHIVERDGSMLYIEYTGLPWEIDALLDQLADSVVACSRAGVLSIRKEARNNE